MEKGKENSEKLNPEPIPILFFQKQFLCKELNRWIGRGHYRPVNEKELEVLQKYASK